VDVIREAFQTHEHGVDVRSGLAGAIAVVAPLGLGLALDDPIAGVIASIGGLNAALGVPRAGITARIWWGTISVLGGAGGVLVADATSGSDAAFVVATFLWVGAWGLLRAAGPTGAVVGFASGAMLVVYGGLPITTPLDERLLWYMAGAVPGAVLMVAARAGGSGRMPAWPDFVRALQDRALIWHVLRLAVAVSAGTLIYRLADLAHGYWIPLTTLAALQPGHHATNVRSVQRAAGTLLAAVLVITVTAVTDQRWPLVACAGATAFLMYALRERGYFWLVVMITPTALLMLSAVDFEGDTVAFDRVTNSLIGIVIGLLLAELARLAATIGSHPQPQRGPP
jgi:hypothetical protein